MYVCMYVCIYIYISLSLSIYIYILYSIMFYSVLSYFTSTGGEQESRSVSRTAVRPASRRTGFEACGKTVPWITKRPFLFSPSNNSFQQIQNINYIMLYTA